MVVTNVQIVTQAASEGLNAKFSDLCDPHDLKNIRSPRKTIATKLSTKSRASSKALRQLRKQQQQDQLQRRSSDFTSTDEEAYLMSLVPLKTTESAKLLNVRRTFKISRLSTSSSPALALHGGSTSMSCSNSPQMVKGQGVTRKLLRLCMGSASANKYTSLQAVY
jgi:hypothetical protein